VLAGFLDINLGEGLDSGATYLAKLGETCITISLCRHAIARMAKECFDHA